MTASEFFEKQKRLNQIDEDIAYEDWLQNRIDNNMPVEGDLKKAYEDRETYPFTINALEDILNMGAVFPTDRSAEKKKKENKSNEIQVRFIKKKQ
ncbi:MAG: hypothetical protein COZ18_04185 [Flexibacter sp. CG_4_10_14_3_um_filter_32_15]|nr:MAG: hypothetical protein COZ18_04185 [Flexibacter sp. CG_4_10_14_3_um_filter_32_15]